MFDRSKREKIIEGFRTLQEECEKVLECDCHKKCQYEDICLMLRVVGIHARPHGTPDMWDFEKVNSDSK